MCVLLELSKSRTEITKIIKKHLMASSKMQAPSSNHLVNKFSANGCVCTNFQVHHPKICRKCVHGKSATRILDKKSRISRSVGNHFYISHEFHGNQSSIPNQHICNHKADICFHGDTYQLVQIVCYIARLC